MNGPLTLRTLRAEGLPLYRSMCALQAAGRPASLAVQAPPRGYAAFRATWEGRGYDGWVDLAGLLRLRFPDIDELAWHAIDECYVLDLFGGNEAAAMIPAPLVAWHDLRLTGVVRQVLPPTEPLLYINEPGLAVALFRAFPLVTPPCELGGAVSVAGLPVALRFRIGTSTVPFVSLAGIEPGDVLIIRSPRNVAEVGGKPFCGFKHEGMDIMLNEEIDEAPDWDDDGLDEAMNEEDARYAQARGDDTPAKSDDATQGLDAKFDVGNVPVKLEFVLHEEPMTVDELARLHTGAVLQMRKGTQTNVAVRANGLLIAKGELVQVGEHLAVELKTVRLAPALSK